MDIPSAASVRPAASGSDTPSVDLVVHIAGSISEGPILDLALMDTAFPTQYFINLITRDDVIPMVLGYILDIVTGFDVSERYSPEPLPVYQLAPPIRLL